MKKHKFSIKVLNEIVNLALNNNFIIDESVIKQIKEIFDCDISDMKGLDIRKPIPRKIIEITDARIIPMIKFGLKRM